MSEPREEVANVIRFVKDSLTAACLMYAVEQDEINPNVYTCAALDDEGHINTGLIGWHEEEQRVSYLCRDPVRTNHDEQEGVLEDDSRCWWEARSAAVFLMNLKGEVREIQAKYRRLVWEAEEKRLDSGK